MAFFLKTILPDMILAILTDEKCLYQMIPEASCAGMHRLTDSMLVPPSVKQMEIAWIMKADILSQVLPQRADGC